MATQTHPTIVFVPGASHSPSCFAPTTTLLHAAGYATVGITLPSVGASPPLQYWAPDVLAIRDTLVSLADQGAAVVLVAHSYGGLVACEAVKDLDRASRQRAGLPGGVIRLVFCCAWFGDVGTSLVEAAGVREHEWPPEWDVRGDLLYFRDPASLFYNDVPVALAACLVAQLQPHSFKSFCDKVTFPAWKYLPSTYIVCEKDRALPLAVQERLLASAGEGGMVVERCDAGHSPFVSQPGFVAKAIRRAAGEVVGE